MTLDGLMFGNLMNNGLFGKVGTGMCRISMNGNIAVKTKNGYKSYDVKRNKLTNCENFVFPEMDNMFFVIPTNRVKCGDIILINGKPKCVIESDNKFVKVINYEDSTIETIIPERHIFMQNVYFYGKIVSLFVNGFGGGKNGMNKMMKFMMMSQMMNSISGSKMEGSNPMSSMLPFMMMNGEWGNMFEGIFDEGFNEDNDESIVENDIEDSDDGIENKEESKNTKN